MFQLSNLRSLGEKRKRIGRGGSRGGTSGRGHKGQNARSGGGVGLLFEGGQMPLARRLPKRGFSNARFKTPCVIVNLDNIEKFFDNEAVITKDSLMEKGLIKPRKSDSAYVLKILGDGAVTKKFTVEAHKFSASAEKAIEKAGGQIKRIT